MATAKAITRQEFEDFILPLGFVNIKIENTKELVYAKIVESNGQKLSLRVYSSLNPDGYSREVGADAIRVALFYRRKDNEIRMVGGDRRVHRVEGWRKNLGDRLGKWTDQIGPECPKCKAPTCLRKPKAPAKWKAFLGCSEYPVCSGSVQLPDLGNIV